MITDINKKIRKYFTDTQTNSGTFEHVIDANSYIFKDESWKHIQTFLENNDRYCYGQGHNSDMSRVSNNNGTIEVNSSAKENNWNCFIYKNASAYDFSFSFEVIAYTPLDEIQVSFNCVDLRKRCRFMIRECKEVVFEIVKDAVFYKHIRCREFPLNIGQKYSIRIIKINKNYQLYIDDELIFSVCDNSSIDFGRDLALILYNRKNNNDINVELSNISLKVNKIYKPKIGILTYHMSQNYGAYLQAYCLLMKLSELNDFDIEIIDYVTLKEKNNYSLKTYKNFATKYTSLYERIKCNRFYRDLYKTFKLNSKSLKLRKSSGSLISDSIQDFTSFIDNKYDIVICGSDEIWRIDSFRGFPTSYWLWGNIHAKKVAYAVSSRSDFNKLTDENRKLIFNNLDSFSYLSFRDMQTINVIQEYTNNKDIYYQPDPTFIYDIPFKEAKLINQKVKGLSQNKRNLLIFLDMVDSQRLVNKLIEDVGDEYNIISIYRYHQNVINIGELDPFEFVELIKEADFVVTNMFHGVCYSIILNKPYLALCTDDKRSKILSLNSNKIDLEKRCFNSPELLISLNMKNVINSLSTISDNKEYLKENRDRFSKFIEELKHISHEY